MQQIKLSSFQRKWLFLFPILILAILMKIEAQNLKKMDASRLILKCEALTNNFQNKRQGLLNLFVTNGAKQRLPATGWNIYFNSKHDIHTTDTESAFSIAQINGNLFRLSPTQSFTGLAVAASTQIGLFVDGQFLNKNDQPEGFYLVWDDAPVKGIAIKNLVSSPIPLKLQNGQLVDDFAAATYAKNATLEQISAQAIPTIFPTPSEYKATNENFILNDKVQINTDQNFAKEAFILAEDLSKLSGQKITVATTNTPANNISLFKKDGIKEEGYELSVKADNISISASSASGIFYGIQSLKTLLPPDAWKPSGQIKIITIPGVEITDAPQFGYRGYLQDVARNFQTKKEILKLLELMALYKLNTFHFHLTDDEGWRIEIDGLPELTSVGAKRGHTLDDRNNMPAAYGSGPAVDSLYGSGFYSKADFIEILKFATARHIKVIPEIETPGHARAAIKSMDARYLRLMKEGKKEEALQFFLRDTLDKSTYTTAQSLHDNVMDVAIPSTYNFIDKVVTEIVKLYRMANAPLTTIHMGGDEVPAGVWERSPDCINLIKNSPSIVNTDGLWYYYLNKLNDILKSKDLTLSGWEEISFRRTMLDGKKINIPNPDFVKDNFKLYVWNNTAGSEDLAYKLANSGYKVVLTFVTNFYLDMAHYNTYEEPGYYWGGYTDLEKVYRFIPFDYLKNAVDNEGRPVDNSLYKNKQRLTNYGKENILGLQGSLWGETLKGPQQLEYMLLPRLLAIAEKAWAKIPAWSLETDSIKSEAGYIKSWSQFNALLDTRELPRLDNYAGGFNYRIPFAGAIVKDGAVYANVQFKEMKIRYTVNGKEPVSSSEIYTKPITQKGIIKLKVFNNMGRSGVTTTIENK